MYSFLATNRDVPKSTVQIDLAVAIIAIGGQQHLTCSFLVAIARNDCAHLRVAIICG